MNTSDADRPQLDEDDRDFVARLTEAYTPEPMSPARRVAFVQRLDDRLQKPRARRAWLPALVGTGALALAVWFALPGATPDTTRVQANAETQRVVEALLALGETTDAIETDIELPDDYAAIESLWLDGEGA